MECSVSFDFKARYFKSVEITPDTRQVWYVLHGYGQLARYFIRKFDAFADKNICVIAPEGLSHFYLEDVESRTRTGNNRVGASWMTRENRSLDMDNYLTLLNTIHEKETSNTQLPIVLFGFSQGCATITRWALQGLIPFQKLILWAGAFPPDMNFENGTRILAEKKVVGVFGNQDPFVTNERWEEMRRLNDRLKIIPEIIRFEGGHEIHTPTLMQLI